MDCQSGYFNNFNGSTTCSSCSIGFYSSDPGSISCLACPDGKVARFNSSVFCQDCPFPSVARPDHTDCDVINCIQGFGIINGICQRCPRNQFGDSSLCRPCAVNTYSPSSGSVRCLDCSGQSGITCPGSSDPIILPNYWGFLVVNPTKESNIYSEPPEQIELKVSECPTGMCPGGTAPALINSIDPIFIIEKY